MTSLIRHTCDGLELERRLDFCEKNPASTHSSIELTWLMTRLTSSGEGIIELREDGRTRLLAMVIDAVASAADCAVLDIIGLTPGLAAEPAVSITVEHAEAFVRAGERAGVEAPLTPQVQHLGPAFESNGYDMAFTGYIMNTPRQAAPDAIDVPGDGWSWVEAGAPHAAEYYDVVHAAMVNVPGSYVASIEESTKAMLENHGTGREWLLLDSGRIAGFAVVLCHPDHTGEVRILGRHPDYRGRALGRHLLVHAMRTLASQGATRFCLDVTATNSAALKLYQRFGFEVAHEEPVFRRLL